MVNVSDGLDLVLVRSDLWPWPVPDIHLAAPQCQWCMEKEAMVPDELKDPKSRAYPATPEKARFWVRFGVFAGGWRQTNKLLLV